MSVSEDHRYPIFQTAPEGSRCRVQKSWCHVKIFQGVVAAVGEILWDRNVCWENSGGALASNDGGASDIMDTVGAPMYVADIWSGLTSVETYCGSGAESCGIRTRLLARDQRLLDISGRVPCRFGIFRSGLTLVEDVNALIWFPGEDIPCVYVGSP